MKKAAPQQTSKPALSSPSATIRQCRESEAAFQIADNRNHSGAQRKLANIAAHYSGNSPAQMLSSRDNRQSMQLKSVDGVASYGNFSDVGSGLFATTQPTNATEVSGLVNKIRESTEHQNIKVLTGTHGDKAGNLVGEQKFYTEDLAHEGHKIPNGGWINVLDVVGKKKDSIGGWMVPGSSAIILAWCYSKASVQNWDAVKHARSVDDYKAGNWIW